MEISLSAPEVTPSLHDAKKGPTFFNRQFKRLTSWQCTKCNRCLHWLPDPRCRLLLLLTEGLASRQRQTGRESINQFAASNASAGSIMLSAVIPSNPNGP